MSIETLEVPEEQLEEVIRVIRAGVKKVQPSPEVEETLLQWCDVADDYIASN